MDKTIIATATAADRSRKRRRALLAIVLGSSIAMLGAGTMSLATFTDSDAVGSSWTSGTIILGVSPSTAFSPTSILPGDSGSQTLTLANTGTGQLRYAMTSTSSNADGKGLAAQMTLTIKAGTCAAPGTTLYSGVLATAALGSTLAGDQGADRTVDAGTSDSLCLTWTFPGTSGNAFQNAATTATFTFASEQTANNP